MSRAPAITFLVLAALGGSCSKQADHLVAVHETSTPTIARGHASDLSCNELLKRDEFVAGEGALALETSTDGNTECTIAFRAGDRTLGNLGVDVDCPPQASILIAFDVNGDTWRLDKSETMMLDNGDCELRIVPRAS